MTTQYSCSKPQRRAQVLDARQNGNPVLNGIDYLEVAPADQTTLLVHFLFPLPGQPNAVPPSPPSPLSAANLVIEGGVRITGITVKQVASNGNLLTVTVPPSNPNVPNIAGDFSTYTLRLISSATDSSPPAGFDPQLAAVDFSFKVECPSEFDCRPTNVCPPPTWPSAQIDYLAKDYASFLQLIFDRLALIMPAWQERHSADIGVALVELLAYAGDQLSYYQEAVATEAYLETARLRVSVRRHARLLDYFMHDGCNARAWVYFGVSGAAPVLVPNQTPLLTKTTSANPALAVADVPAALNQGAQAFQTLFDLTAHPELNELDFYTWSDEGCCLPQGATQATLADVGGAGALLQAALATAVAQGGAVYLLFEEVLGPATGAAADADPAHRQVVRLIQATPGQDPLNSNGVIAIAWDPADSLTFPLCLWNSQTQSDKPAVSVARGNIVLADHGLNPYYAVLHGPNPPVPPPEGLPDPPSDPSQGFYRPTLAYPGLTFTTAYGAQQPASASLVQDPSQALPAIELEANGSTWTPVRDLLSSPRTALNFVVEMQDDGTASLRFGDGVLGSKAVAGLIAAYRVGNGTAGAIGAEALFHFVSTPAIPLTGIATVRNPLPALGGVDGESLDQVRNFAPAAFRTQERAVTAADYATMAERHPQVKQAQATLRWTGSWYTMFVTIDRAGGLPVDDAFRTTIRDFLEQFRLAGYDLEIDAPIFVPLDIAFTVCVAPRYFRSAVELALLQTFSNQVLPGGQLGFFHPDNFTFGQPVYLSRVVAAAMNVPGVRWVDTNDKFPSPNHFKRWGHVAQGETEAGRITMARLEIARLDNDPSQPENGKIVFFMQGGI
jgi:hypothetical protein